MPALGEGGKQMARDTSPGRGSARPSAKPGKSAKPVSTKREELSAERRAALELRRAARESRGKPPSI